MLKIFAIDTKIGEREEIEDLYWFEENGVHSLDDGQGHHATYVFEIRIGDGPVIEMPQRERGA